MLGRTPYARIASAESRAHPTDVEAVEMALDRAGSAFLHAAAMALPSRERLAKTLLRAAIRERDAALAVRLTTTLGLSFDAAAGMTVVLGDEIGASGLAALAARPDRGRAAMRADRRVACRRAFVEDPFQLAAPIALVLEREDEVRALISLAEVRMYHVAPADAVGVLRAAS